MSYLKMALAALQATTSASERARKGNVSNQAAGHAPSTESSLTSKKTPLVCPRCQGEISLRTSSDKTFCFQCFFNMDGEIDISPTCLNEVDRVLEAAVEAAEERAAILEHDGGLQQQEADETARAMHIQPVIDDLLRRGLVSIEGG
jgi:hypothetical protein